MLWNRSATWAACGAPLATAAAYSPPRSRLTCAGYLDYPFENEQGKSCLDTLARDKWMEEKFG